MTRKVKITAVETSEKVAAIAKVQHQQIPKLIHKIWWQSISSLPDKYKKPLDSWKEQNPSWTIVVWDEVSIVNLLEEHFPQYYVTFKELPKMIQKIDMAKYFILAKYGGCYTDMDQTCLRSLDNIVDTVNEKATIIVSPLTNRLSLIPLTSSFCFTKPPFINNAFIISKPDVGAWLPVFKQVVREFSRAQGSRRHDPMLKSPEVMVLRTTGPVCFTKGLRKLMKSKKEQSPVRLLDPDLVEPFSVYFKMGDTRNFSKIVNALKLQKSAIAISAMPSTWTNAHSKTSLPFRIVRKYVENVYRRDLRNLIQE